MQQTSVQRSLRAFPGTAVLADHEVALDIDPLRLRVRVQGTEHRFDDCLAMEAFLRRLWERTTHD